MRLIPFGLLSGESRRVALLRWSAETLTWTLIGGLTVLAARESGRNGVRAVGWTVAVAGSLSLAIELMQLVVPGRSRSNFGRAIARRFNAGCTDRVAIADTRPSPLDLAVLDNLVCGYCAGSVESAQICVAQSTLLADRDAGPVLVLLRRPHS